MIELLNKRVDSLNQIINTERSDKEQLNQQLVKLRTQIKELNATVQNVENEKNKLITTAAEKEAVYTKTLKLKQDSLALLATELLKYRPAPVKEEPKLIVKQDNSGPIKSVTIGTQVWMVENLNIATFRNGVAISEAKSDEEWKKARENKQPAWCYYDNDPKNGVKYGKLYNWYAVVDTNGVCPQGWHVPSDAEWDTLINYLGGEDVAGAKMKAKPVMKKGVEYYDVDSKNCNNCARASAEYKKICPVCKGTGSVKIPLKKEKYVYDYAASGFEGGTNESGFTGLPGGYRGHDGLYYSVGRYGYWWSSKDNTIYAWYRYLKDINGIAYRDKFLGEKNGFSVRCLRD